MAAACSTFTTPAAPVRSSSRVRCPADIRPPSAGDPFAIAALAGMPRAASQESLVLLATQSAILMNQFELGDLIVVERRDGASVFDRPDPDRLSEWLADHSLGELWENNLLGGRHSRSAADAAGYFRKPDAGLSSGARSWMSVVVMTSTEIRHPRNHSRTYGCRRYHLGNMSGTCLLSAPQRVSHRVNRAARRP